MVRVLICTIGKGTA